jgi:hypothetical protein
VTICNCRRVTGLKHGARGIIENVFHLEYQTVDKAMSKVTVASSRLLLCRLAPIINGLCKFWLAEPCPAIGQIWEIRVVLQDSRFLCREDLIQI